MNQMSYVESHSIYGDASDMSWSFPRKNKELPNTTNSLFLTELIDPSLLGCEHHNLPITSAEAQGMGAEQVRLWHSQQKARVF